VAQWGFLLFRNERISCDEFLLFRNGWLCRDGLFLLFGVGKFSLQIFLSVLPGDIYLWVFLFRSKRFFATAFSVYNGRFLPPRFLTVLSRTVLPLRFFAAVP
jgi:hypothetical protein